MVLIMCYSGFRIKAFTNMETNLKEQYFKGGVKTRASKERIVPIHPAIYDMVKARCNGKNLLHCSANDFRQKMKYEVNENDRKRMMGHSFGSDITNAKYGHRTLEELRTQIEKIKPPLEEK